MHTHKRVCKHTHTSTEAHTREHTLTRSLRAPVCPEREHISGLAVPFSYKLSKLLLRVLVQIQTGEFNLENTRKSYAQKSHNVHHEESITISINIKSQKQTSSTYGSSQRAQEQSHSWEAGAPGECSQQPSRATDLLRGAGRPLSC